MVKNPGSKLFRFRDMKKKIIEKNFISVVKVVKRSVSKT